MVRGRKLLEGSKIVYCQDEGNYKLTLGRTHEFYRMKGENCRKETDEAKK